jgi:hypothetical protein
MVGRIADLTALTVTDRKATSNWLRADDLADRVVRP